MPAPLPQKSGHLLAISEIASSERFDLEESCRARSQTVFLGNHRLLARMLGRYKIFLDARDLGFASHIALDGYWETWLTQFIARRIKPGMVVADIGANFGYYSVLMADLVGSRGRLVAVEPNPPAAAFLADTLSVNGLDGWTRILPAAIGVEAGKALLRVPDFEPKNASIMADGAKRDQDDASFHEVPVVSLDDLFRPEERIDFLKIDAEGAEEAIMLGFSKTLESARPDIVLEFNPGRCVAPAELIARLRGWYPLIRVLGFDGSTVDASDTDILDLGNREDRLLFLSRQQ